MQKIAHDQSLSAEQLRSIATLGFATALSSPLLGFSPKQTKEAAGLFTKAMNTQAEREAKLKQTLLEFIKA
jgi:hypothetical protein